MASFAEELQDLIRRHIGAPQFGNDYMEVCEALEQAHFDLDDEADELPWKHDNGALDDKWAPKPRPTTPRRFTARLPE